jgi:hypothetical protein
LRRHRDTGLFQHNPPIPDFVPTARKSVLWALGDARRL